VVAGDARFAARERGVGLGFGLGVLAIVWFERCFVWLFGEVVGRELWWWRWWWWWVEGRVTWDCFFFFFFFSSLVGWVGNMLRGYWQSGYLQ